MLRLVSSLSLEGQISSVFCDVGLRRVHLWYALSYRGQRAIYQKLVYLSRILLAKRAGDM